MSVLTDEEALIVSSNGDVRGRRGLVQEIRRIKIDNSNEQQNKVIESDTLWNFDANKMEPSTRIPCQNTNKSSSSVTDHRTLAPIFEQKTKNGVYYSSFIIDRKTCDRWDLEGKNKDNREINRQQMTNNVDRDHYTHSYGSPTQSNTQPEQSTQWQAATIPREHSRPSYTPQSSRNSSIRSYDKALPVGKYAKQKFHIVQDEEELIDNLNIPDPLTGKVSNLDQTCEYDSINESVIIGIADFKTAHVDIKIEWVKYSRKATTDRRWSKKKTEVMRTVTIDLDKSGYGRIVHSLIYDTMIHLDPLPEEDLSVYRVNIDEFQLTNQAAYMIFNVLMSAAENDVAPVSTKSEAYKRKFTPRYLLALLREEETIDYF